MSEPEKKIEEIPPRITHGDIACKQMSKRGSRAIFQRLTCWKDHANAGQMVEREKIFEIIVIAEISFLDPFCKNYCDTITHLIQQSKHDYNTKLCKQMQICGTKLSLD